MCRNLNKISLNFCFRFFNCTNTSKDLCDEMASFLEVLLGKLSKAVKEARIKNVSCFIFSFSNILINVYINYVIVIRFTINI